MGWEEGGVGRGLRFGGSVGGSVEGGCSGIAVTERTWSCDKGRLAVESNESCLSCCESVDLAERMS